MIQLVRTNSENKDFIDLVKLLDADLKVRDGDDHEFYNQYNAIDTLNHVVIAYYNDEAIGCGAFKQMEHDAVEIKRMYVNMNHRGNKIATKLLANLELWVQESGFKKMLLETGTSMPEAIGLYKKFGYQVIENYGQYKGIDTSVCFQKDL
ncbi:GNAT family N-acetyltransferase [Candidatus Marifrigoribacter sp. Uisw_064]|uniref:GNAT family N-acetyltransferase n=1 Tax=Candidatus Marifrigoribacter sp. Uisw_064 TaxID=3230970 RepID=UPI003D43DF08